MPTHTQAAISKQELATRCRCSLKRVNNAIARGEIRPVHTEVVKRRGKPSTIIVNAEGAERDLLEALAFTDPRAPAPRPSPKAALERLADELLWPGRPGVDPGFVPWARARLDRLPAGERAAWSEALDLLEPALQGAREALQPYDPAAP